MNSPQHFADQYAERLARLEVNVEFLVEQGRENRAEHRDFRNQHQHMLEQIRRIRTTDFRILVGLLISCHFATVTLLYKLLGH